ncbi:hypothetical protein ABZT03_38810 [Streptomyces sp. NPDC005574]|uniref:hypothetical protein n=1 Tax=Streptomyces sp. NPDC005574 TaxID=3156891 RepID=UPI0033B45499
MGREVRRVPLDFDWPLNKVWEGFLSPDSLDGEKCPDCKSGYSPRAENLYDLWYGKIPFDPATTGSTPWDTDTPAIRARAERNIAEAPDYYGRGEAAILREAQRLAEHFNSGWLHHLDQDDVNALLAADRLRDFTHTFDPEKRWQPKQPPVTPTAAEVNEWSLSGFGHDSINASVVIRSRCEREGVDDTCPTCQGHATVEKYDGQRAEAEAWEPTDPPKGDGWQLWETVSEGSPISPVFATADGLAAWMSDPERGDRWVPQEVAAKFIADGWAPSFASGPGVHGLVSGVEWAGTQDD